MHSIDNCSGVRYELWSAICVVSGFGTKFDGEIRSLRLPDLLRHLAGLRWHNFYGTLALPQC